LESSIYERHAQMCLLTYLAFQLAFPGYGECTGRGVWGKQIQAQTAESSLWVDNRLWTSATFFQVKTRSSADPVTPETSETRETLHLYLLIINQSIYLQLIQF
jgi:hypothetical protein